MKSQGEQRKQHSLYLHSLVAWVGVSM